MTQSCSDDTSPLSDTSGFGPILADAVGVIHHSASTTALISIARNVSAPLAVGELVGIDTAAAIILAEVTTAASPQEGPTLFVTLVGSVRHREQTITRGATLTPPGGSSVYRLAAPLLRAWLEGRNSVGDSDQSTISIKLGRSPLCPSEPLSFSPERIFGRHCAVVGTSGSGKSWSTARLIEESATHNAKVILIDPSGEYRALEHGVRHLHLGTSPLANLSSHEAILPYYELTEADLVAVLRPTDAIQLTKLRAAIRSLKLLQYDPRLGVDGNLPKAHRSKTPYEMAYNEFREEICGPQNSFNIQSLPMQIGLECVDPIRSQTESSYWGGMNTTDHTACVPLIHRLEDLLQSNELSAIFTPSEGESLLTAIESFLSDQSASVLRISFEYLPTVSRVRETIANAIARHLLGIARGGHFIASPLIVVVDEAHQVLSKDTSALSDSYPLEAFNVIAREGRKYGLVLSLATQRPGDIPDDVLSQIGTFLVHRLVSDIDRRAIERASGGMSAELRERLPLLGPGEAFLLGVDFHAPLRLFMERPLSPPRSNGPDFQNAWGQTTLQ